MANDNDVELRVSANASDVKVGMSDAQKSVTDATRAMNETMRQLSADSRKSMEEMGTTVKGLTAEFTQLRAGAVSAFDGIHAAMTKFSSTLIGITAALAGGHVIKEFIGDFTQEAADVGKLARTFGVTMDAASTLNVQLKLVGMTADDFTGIAFKMMRQLKTNEEGLNSLGLATRDGQGHIRNLLDITKDAASVMMEYEEGIDRDSVAMQLFGRNAEEAMKILKLSAETEQRAGQLREQYGIGTTKEALAEAKKYKMEQAAIGIVMDELKEKIGESLMPAMLSLTSWFAEIGPTAIEFTVAGIKHLIQFFEETVAIGRAMWNDLSWIFNSIATAGATLAAQITALAHGNVAGAKEIGAAGMADMERLAKEHGDKEVAIFQGVNDRLKKLWAERPTGAAEEDAPKGGHKKAPGFGKKEKGGKESSDMSGFAQELAIIKAAQEAEGEYMQFSKEQELAFWQERVGWVKKGSDDELAILLKVAELKSQLNKESSDAGIKTLEAELAQTKGHYDEQIALIRKIGLAKQMQVAADSAKVAEIEAATEAKVRAVRDKQVAEATKLQEEITKAAAKAAEDQIAFAEQGMELSFQLGLINVQEKLALEQGFENQRWEIKLKAFDDDLALLDRDTLAYQKMLDTKLEAERQHELKQQKLKNQSVAEENKPKAAVEASFESGVSGGLTGILMKETTAAQALANLYKQTATTFLNEMITKPLAQMAMRAIRETGIYQTMMGNLLAFFGLKKVAETTDAVQGVAAAKASALGIIPAEAATAAGGAAAAMASIPYVGPVLAAAAYAETMALVLSGMALVSAAGGFDIPAGMNPRTQLHEREMVLPAHLADPMRDMLAGGGSMGGDTHLHIHTMDTRSMAQFCQANAGPIFDAVKLAARNGRT